MFDNNEIVLVADGDHAVRQSVKFALELEGLTVGTCASGEELFRHPDLDRASCLVFDHHMADRDGLEIADLLAERGVRGPRVLTTQTSSVHLRREAAKRRVVRVLEKPLLGDVLAKAIRDAMAQGRDRAHDSVPGCVTAALLRTTT